MDIIVNVLGVSPYSFNDKESGRLVEGANVFYTELQTATNGKDLGFVPKKASVNNDVYNALKGETFPFNAKVIVTQTLGNKGVYAKVTGFQPTVRK